MESIDLSTHILYWNTDVIWTQGIPVEISYGNDTPNVIVNPSATTQGEMFELYNRNMWHLFIVALR
jgi:hypothetical protein